MTRADADVVVIGGGIVGLMTAWYLARDGADVIAAGGRRAGGRGLRRERRLAASADPVPRIRAPTARAGRGPTLPVLRFLAASLAHVARTCRASLARTSTWRSRGGLGRGHDAPIRCAPSRPRRGSRHRPGVETEILDRDALRRIAPYSRAERHRCGLLRERGQGEPAARDAGHRRGGGERPARVILRDHRRHRDRGRARRLLGRPARTAPGELAAWSTPRAPRPPGSPRWSASRSHRRVPAAGHRDRAGRPARSRI